MTSCHPPSPSGGGSAHRCVPGGQRLCRSCLLLKAARTASVSRRALLPPCTASPCHARGLLRQGPASRRTSRTATAVWAPARARGRARGHRCWRTWHGRGLACSVVAACPHTPRRSLRSVVGRMVFYWPGCVLPGTSGGSRAPSPDRQPWRWGPWRWPAPGSRTRLPVAAALFLPPHEAQGNPGGATSRAGLAALGAPAHP